MFFSNKPNNNKIYDFSTNILNKTNDQTLKKSTVSTIKKRQQCQQLKFEFSTKLGSNSTCVKTSVCRP
jgi:hypothetical protein